MSLFEANCFMAADESLHMSMDTDLYSLSKDLKQICSGSWPGMSNCLLTSLNWAMPVPLRC